MVRLRRQGRGGSEHQRHQVGDSSCLSSYRWSNDERYDREGDVSTLHRFGSFLLARSRHHVNAMIKATSCLLYVSWRGQVPPLYADVLSMLRNSDHLVFHISKPCAVFVCGMCYTKATPAFSSVNEIETSTLVLQAINPLKQTGLIVRCMEILEDGNYNTQHPHGDDMLHASSPIIISLTLAAPWQNSLVRPHVPYCNIHNNRAFLHFNLMLRDLCCYHYH